LLAEVENCKYDYEPKDFNDMIYFADMNAEYFNFSVDVDSPANYTNIYVKCYNGCGDDYAYNRKIRVLPKFDNNYPKLGNYMLSPSYDDTSQPAALAKYDLIIFESRGVRRTSFLERIKDISPETSIIYYTTSWSGDSQKPKPDFFINDLNYFLDDSWRLRNSNGDYIINYAYQNEDIYNINTLFDEEYTEALTDYMGDFYLKRGIFDGIYYDNFNAGFWWLHEEGWGPYQLLDIDRDGEDEDINDVDTCNDNPDCDYRYVLNIWKEGINLTGNLTDEKYGTEQIVVGNGANDDPTMVNGRLFEGKLSMTDFSRYNGLFGSVNYQGSFLYWMENSRDPKMVVNVFFNPYSSYAYERYGLSASLLFGMYHHSVPGQDQYDSLRWFDEYWVDMDSGKTTTDLTVGRGYLGEPIDEYPIQLDDDKNVFKRRFDNGIVLFNNASSYTFDLGKYYRLINGTQDPNVNTGELVNSVTLTGRDGRVLLIPKCNNNPNGDADCYGSSYDYDVELETGWNYISIPIQIENNDPSQLGNIILTYVDNEWKLNYGDYREINSLTPLRGYIVYSDEEREIGFIGGGIDDPIAIVEGEWNLIGFPVDGLKFIDYYPDLTDYSVYGWHVGEYYELPFDFPLNYGDAYFVGPKDIEGSPPGNLNRIIEIIEMDNNLNLGNLLVGDEFEKRMLLEKFKK
jgi:hypothetical protein